MAKMKIYEISRSLQGAFPDLKSKDLIKLLQENGFRVKSAQSSIEDDAIKFLLNKFQNKKAEPAKVAEEPVKAEPVEKKETKEKKEPKEKKTEAAKTEEKTEQKAKPVEEEGIAAYSMPGSIARVTKNEIFVQTGDGVLCLHEVQLEGKKRMKVHDFLLGCKVEEGEVLG